MRDQELQHLATLAKILVDSVEYDINGFQGKGGNGGLTSTDTIDASYKCRAALSRLKHERKIE